MKINFTQMFVWAVIPLLMICQTHLLQAQAGLTINSPANIAGTSIASIAIFGPQLNDIGPITGDLIAMDGCTDPDACNFDPEATDDDDCVLPGDICNDENPFTENDIIQADCSCAGVYNPNLEPECYEVNSGTDISTDAIGGYGILAADLDGDGDNDILTGTTDDRVVWYENDGQGNFGSENTIASDFPLVNSVYVSDLDGDGDKDVLAASFLEDKAVWYENDGQGNFGSENIISMDVAGTRDIYAIDLDGDGDNDVLTASGDDGKFAWYENDGQGNFGSQNIIDVNMNIPNDIHAADFDGDGDNDVLVGSLFASEAAWYENDGQGGFGTPNIIVANPGTRVFRVDAADFDGDGDNDVLITNIQTEAPFGSTIVWHENDGQGGFGTENLISTSQSIMFSIHITDIEDDGDNDILATIVGPQDGRVVLFENDGQGSFTESIISSNLASAWATYAADFDGDGDKDILASDTGGFSNGEVVNGQVVWYENDCEEVVEETIPTVSEWGLIILGLILLNLGVLYIRQTEMRIKQA